METRKRRVVKVLHEDHVFTGTSKFPAGQLPTARDTFERMLHEKNWSKEVTALQIAEELVGHWVFCNVYTLHQYSVRDKISILMKKFFKLCRYPMKKRGKKFRDDVEEFMVTANKLFDIFLRRPC